MAISRGAGTEIIRSIYLKGVDSTVSNLIVGVQHHIYTVLSLVVFADVLDAATDAFIVRLTGYDSKAGTTDSQMRILETIIPVNTTFVWNDKFSFNGAEPANFTGPMNDATKQDAIADQGSAPVSQFLQCLSGHADDVFTVVCTYIDQNNA